MESMLFLIFISILSQSVCGIVGIKKIKNVDDKKLKQLLKKCFVGIFLGVGIQILIFSTRAVFYLKYKGFF